MTPTLANTEAEILARVIAPETGSLPTDFAKLILSLDFPQHDKDRMHQLAQKAQEGELLPEEQNEIDGYERVGHFISIVQTKARISLKQTTSQQ